MAKYDHGGGCPCGLYKECKSDCEYYKGNENMKDDIFDFGFTAIDEDELQSVETSRNQVEEMQKELERVDNRAKMLYDAITPLLDNLRKSPDKEYILWPDRVSKIDDFQAKLLGILEDGKN